jgi:hypothetical protein
MKGSLVTVGMPATEGTSATAQMLATVWDASNIRDVKNIMQVRQHQHGGKQQELSIEAFSSMDANTAVTLAIAKRLE